MKNPRYQLPNGQWAIKAHIAETQEAGVTSYRWEAELPEDLLQALRAGEQVYWQPVFYSDKFGISRPEVFFALLKVDSKAVH